MKINIYVGQEWLSRQNSKSGLHNVQSNPLVELNKILLPTLHIKLGVMKFVKAIDKEGRGFVFLRNKFPRVNMEKLQTGIFDGPQIRELVIDPIFDEALNEDELSGWQVVVTNF